MNPRYRRLTFLLFLLLLLGLYPPRAEAKVASLGVDLFAVDSSGTKLTGAHQVILCLSSSGTTRTCISEETKTPTFDEGILHTNMDLTSSLSSLTSDEYLYVTLDGVALPTVQMQASAYTLKAATCDALSSGNVSITGNLTVSGTVTATGSVSGSSTISSVTAGTALSGGGSSGTVTVNADVGTTASKLVRLDSSAKLPAVDGSQLTSITPGDSTVTTASIVDRTIAEADVGLNILDFAEFKDSMALDANLTVSQTTNTWSQTFSGTTGPGFTYTASGAVTSGTAAGMYVNVSSTTASVPAMQITNAGTGNSFVVEDQASDPTPFAISKDGDVSLGRNLIMTPSATQTLSATSDTISANAAVVLLNPTIGLDLASTPTIADGTNGQILILINVSTVSATTSVTLQDNKFVAGTNLRLSANQVTIQPYDTITLQFSSSIGDWVQIAQSNNVGP